MTEARLACLHGNGWSIVFECPDAGPPIWRHIGERVDPAGLPALASLRGATTFSLDEPVPMAAIPLGGTGWFGPSVLAVRSQDGAALLLSDWQVEETADRLVILSLIHI